jgi:hypothetical protein
MGVICTGHAQTNEWYWMNGLQTPQLSVYDTLGTPDAKNLPGNRTSAVSWADSKDNLWLFGGNGSASTGRNAYLGLNDLW